MSTEEIKERSLMFLASALLKSGCEHLIFMICMQILCNQKTFKNGKHTNTYTQVKPPVVFTA